ncbi:unnamed protein product [Lupinus luteus]|uniref:Uncharacterized protein n=1 Tax=Lupinus luteus TaxID=3873 RepID=A0AAV1X1D6_LUPLU
MDGISYSHGLNDQFHQLRPIPCKDLAPTQISQCKSTTVGQAAILYSGLYLVALGTGGIKATLPALGADQFDAKNPKEATQLSSFFNWFLFSLTIGSIFGVTLINWIGPNHGWGGSFDSWTTQQLLQKPHPQDPGTYAQ